MSYIKEQVSTKTRGLLTSYLNGVGTKPSIILTPTAYEDGKLNSVKPAKTFGSELVTNGTFDTDTDWTKGTGWSISGGKAIANNVPNLQRLQQGLGTSVVGKKYKYSLNITNVSGFYSVYIFGVYVKATSNTEGVIEGEFIATSTNGAFFIAGASAGGLVSATIDNVSVKEIIDADFDFTRGSSATRVNELGLVEDVTDTDLPRINYTDGEGSLLLEPQSTNLVTYSEDFSQWTRNTTYIDTPSNVTQTNPSGGSESGFININNGVSSTKFIYEPISTSSSIHTQSVFFKYHSRQWIQLVSGGTSHYANFDIQNGVVGNVSGCTATIEYYGSGWYKCTVTLSSAGTPTNMVIAVLDDDATSRIPTSTGTGSYYMWAAQTEALSYATSYIPTNGSTVTRSADVCNNSGSSDLINSTEGVLYAEIAALREVNDNVQFLSLGSGSYTSNSIYLQLRSAANQYAVWAYSNNLNQLASVFSVTDIKQFNKIAISYKLNDFKVYVNGSVAYTNTTYSPPTANSLNVLEFTRDTSNPFYGNAKCLAVFKEALSDTELEKLTTI